MTVLFTMLGSLVNIKSASRLNKPLLMIQYIYFPLFSFWYMKRTTWTTLQCKSGSIPSNHLTPGFGVFHFDIHISQYIWIKTRAWCLIVTDKLVLWIYMMFQCSNAVDLQHTSCSRLMEAHTLKKAMFWCWISEALPEMHGGMDISVHINKLKGLWDCKDLVEHR